MSNHHRSTLPLSEHTLTGSADAAELATLFSHPAVFLEPDRLVSPTSWIEHIPFAFWLVDVVRPRVFAELGTHSGNSYAAFAQAVQHLNLTATGYAIDTWKGDPHAGFYDESVFTEWRAYHDRRYASFSRLVRSTFDEALGHFADRSVDLLNIDGYHTTEAVNHDFHAWLPKMSDRGVVLLHDINVRESNFGAWQVWEKLRATYPSFTFLHGHGLGVLAVGEEVPAPLAWLAGLESTQSTDVARVREFFARIGGTILARAQIAELAASNASVTSLDMPLADAHGQASGLTQRPAAARARIGDANELLRARDAEIAALRASLERAAAEEKRRTEANADAQTQLMELSKELLNHTRVRAFQESLSLASAQSLAAATGQIGALKARISVLSRALARSPRATSTRMMRALGTAQSLGATPRAVARRPGSVRTLLRLALSPRAVRDAHLITHSGLFDVAYYTERFPDVMARGLNPLAHFVLSGGAEGRSPHPLFDSAWYLAQYPDVAATGVNPLAHYLRTASREDRDPHLLFSTTYYRAQVSPASSPEYVPLQHYVRHGVFEGRSPHPLFDPDYYVDTYGQALSGLDPLVHFLTSGAASDFNPHPLFDTRYYREQVPELRGSTHNPLYHYLKSAPSRNRRPHPLFDPTFYLRSYRDVSSSGLEPLTHFVLTGGAEGRRPIPEFDSAWYLATYSDVGRNGANPLVHFVRHGWSEHRNPSPNFDTAAYLGRYPDVAKRGINPLVHFVNEGRAEGRRAVPESEPERVSNLHEPQLRLRASNLTGSTRVGRAVVCLTHVMPVHPRAGNEYRIHRMLRWLRRSGYIVIPIVAPAEGTPPTAADIHAVTEEFGNVIVCHPEGRLEYLLRDVPDVLQSLDDEPSPPWATRLGEDRFMSQQERTLLTLERAFCTDTVIATVLRLQSALGPYVLLAEYIWMSRVLPLAAPRALKVIDTIDVFSTRAEKVGRYGIDDLTIEPAEERVRLERADLLIAIQENERAVLETLAPDVRTITSGVDFDVASESVAPTNGSVLCVASGNPMNRRGLQSFLRFCWPRVRELVPTAELLVVGAVGDGLLRIPPGVRILGKVAALEPLYQACRVAINPAVAGTGVKIKTLEALAHLRPIVTWPNGVDGLSRELAGLCLTAHDWHSFASLVADTLNDGRPSWFSGGDREILRREGSSTQVYATLGREIETFFARAACARPAMDARGPS